MPAATVIDQLIVKLGLDPKDFNKGQKQAAAAVVETEKVVKRSSESMSKSIVGFTGKLLGVATAAIAVQKVMGAVSELSTTVRQLGIDSRNFGIAANELRNFQNVGAMMGGKAEEVTRSIGNITKAVYDLAYNGQISDSLIMLGRLGVQFQDTAGNARSFRDIALDTEKAIQGLMSQGTTRENAGQMLAQAGFDPGLSQAMLTGTLSQRLAQQEGRRQVNGTDVGRMTRWEESASNRDQAIAAAGLGAPTTIAQAEAGTAANNALAAGADYAGNATGASVGETLGNVARGVKDGGNKLVDAMEELGARALRAAFPKGRRHYEQTIQDAAAKHGIDPEVLAGVLSTESNFDPSAVNKSGATGIAQLMPKYFPKAGRSPHNDINDAAKYLRELEDDFLASGHDPATAQRLALQSYNAGQSRVRKSMRPGGKSLKKETLDYPGKVLGYAADAVPSPGAQGASGGGSGARTNEVNIGKVIVETQATDAEGIARDFAGATRRKLLAAQADAGMQ